MAATAEAARLTEAHRLAQLKIGAGVMSQSIAAWQLLDPEDINGTIEQWLAVMVPLVRSARRTSARLSANYLRTFRALELGIDAGPFTPVLAEELPLRQITTSLVVTGPAKIRAAANLRRPMARVLDVAQAGAAGAAMRHTLNGGRGTVTETVAADSRAMGWARVTSGRACAFCAMLAGRGPIYSEGSAEFDAHDHCSCSAEPVYRRDAAWPAGARRYEQIWQESTAGLAGDDARIAFRRAIGR